MKRREIGTVEIAYSNGKAVNAVFIPNQNILGKKSDLIERLNKMGSPVDDVEAIKQADIVLSTFFSAVDEIELIDQEKFKIGKEVIECIKEPVLGTVMYCSVKYFLTEL